MPHSAASWYHSQFCTHRARPENLDSASLHLGRGQTAYSLQDTLPGSCKHDRARCVPDDLHAARSPGYREKKAPPLVRDEVCLAVPPCFPCVSAGTRYV